TQFFLELGSDLENLRIFRDVQHFQRRRPLHAQQFVCIKQRAICDSQNFKTSRKTSEKPELRIVACNKFSKVGRTSNKRLEHITRHIQNLTTLDAINHSERIVRGIKLFELVFFASFERGESIIDDNEFRHA